MTAPTWENVQTAIGRDLSTAEQARTTHWIALTRATIHGRLGDLDALDEGDLNLVTIEAVAQKLNRPTGETQVSTQIDGATIARSWGSDTVYIRAEWWDLLAPSMPGATTLIPKRTVI